MQVYRLTEALEQSQLEASLAKQQQQTTDAQLVKASTSAALLETELHRLQQDHEALAQQVSSLTAGKASADRAAAVGETRAATAEALLSSKSQELEQLQVHYKRLLTEQQAELERLRQQLHSQSAEQTKAASAAATREQDLLRELQAANSSMVELKTGLAAERSSSQLLQVKVTELTSELEAARQGKQQLAANLKQVCVPLRVVLVNQSYAPLALTAVVMQQSCSQAPCGSPAIERQPGMLCMLRTSNAM